MTEWWMYCQNISSLYRFLVDTDRLDPGDVSAVTFFLSRPYRWSLEFSEMTARRVPNDADAHEACHAR